MIAASDRGFWRFWVFAFLACWLAVTLAACNPSSFRVQAAQGTQLVISTLSDPKTFNPALGNEFPPAYLLTHDGLTGEDGYGNLVPGLAEKWEVSPDKKRIVFTLREGLKWSDGQPVTADDVVFSFNDIYLNEEIPTDTRDILRIGETGQFPQVKKLDDRRVEFVLPAPFSPFLRSAGATILPAHILRESVKTKDSQGKPKFLSMWDIDTPPKDIVGTGPYLIDSYTTSQRLVFRKNPYYWGRDPDGSQQPHIDRLVWQIIESTDTQVVKFRSGDLDLIDAFATIRPEDFSLLKREAKRGKFEIVFGGPRAGTLYVSFNQNKGRRNGKPLVDPIKSKWFNNVAFRQAVAYALNRQSMIEKTFRGLAQPQDSPISVQSPYYLSSKEGLKTYGYDPQKAKELLLGAGFKYNDRNQLLDADGHLVRFTMITNAENKTRVSLAAQVKQDLSKIGIQVDLNPIAFNILVDKLDNSLDWECYLLGFTGGVEPNSGFNLWNPDGGSHSFNQKPQVGRPPIEGREVTDWEKEIGKLYIQAAQEFDDAKRKALYAKTQQITQEYLPYIYLANQTSMAAIRNKVKGVKYTALGGTYWNLAEQRVDN
jgi:peptide/nickel transport system substrate-binding protein